MITFNGIPVKQVKDHPDIFGCKQCIFYPGGMRCNLDDETNDKAVEQFGNDCAHAGSHYEIDQ